MASKGVIQVILKNHSKLCVLLVIKNMIWQRRRKRRNINLSSEATATLEEKLSEDEKLIVLYDSLFEWITIFTMLQCYKIFFKVKTIYFIANIYIHNKKKFACF